MIDTVDLRSIRQPTADDPAGLNALLRQIVGQPFLFFRPTYADEMTLHLGATREPASSKLRGVARGSYVLTFRGSLWQVESPLTAVLAYSRPGGDVGPARRLGADALVTNRLVGSRTPVEQAVSYFSEDAGGYVLYVGFADGSRLVVKPEYEVSRGPEDAPEAGLPEISDWELLTPYGRHLKVGPGAEWSYLPSGAGAAAP